MLGIIPFLVQWLALSNINSRMGMGSLKSPWALLSDFQQLSEDEVETFMPQVCNILVDREIQEQPSVYDQFERIVLDKCSRCFPFGVRFCNTLHASAANVNERLFRLGSTQQQQRDDRLRVLQDQADAATSKGWNLPSSVSNLRSTYSKDTASMLDTLSRIGIELKKYPVNQRPMHLKSAIQQYNSVLFNRMMSRGNRQNAPTTISFGHPIYTPQQVAQNCPEVASYSLHLPIQHSSDRVMRILRFVETECECLPSKERCPYLVVVELLEEPFTYRSEALYTKGHPIGLTMEDVIIGRQFPGFPKSKGGQALLTNAATATAPAMTTDSETDIASISDQITNPIGTDEDVNIATIIAEPLSEEEIESNVATFARPVSETRVPSGGPGGHTPDWSNHYHSQTDHRQGRGEGNQPSPQQGTPTTAYPAPPGSAYPPSNHVSDSQYPCTDLNMRTVYDQKQPSPDWKVGAHGIQPDSFAGYGSTGSSGMESSNYNNGNTGEINNMRIPPGFDNQGYPPSNFQSLPSDINHGYTPVNTENDPTNTGGWGQYSNPMQKIFIRSKTWEERKAIVQQASPFGHLEGWNLKSFIVKSGDDLRKEVLAMQVIDLMRKIFEVEGVDINLSTYQIVSTGRQSGLVEFIEGARSVDNIKKSCPDVPTLLEYFQFTFGATYSPTYNSALQNFVKSLAGYSLVTYVLAVRDRHNANILIGADGSIIHIDFGFVLGDSPGFNMNFENAPFKLTREYLELMGGPESPAFKMFEDLFIRGFSVLQKNSEAISALVQLFYGSRRKAAGDQVRARLNFASSQQDVVGLIRDSLDNWRTKQYDWYQQRTNGIVM